MHPRACVYFYDDYNQWKGEKRIDELAQELRRLDKEDYERKAADKIGGKTPQETLDLFIQAVENGDYELASKYFVVEKQEEWRGRLEVIIRDNLETALNNYSTFSVEKGIEDDKAYYYIKMPFDKSESGYIFSPVIFRFNLYSKIWKIAVL